MNEKLENILAGVISIIVAIVIIYFIVISMM